MALDSPSISSSATEGIFAQISCGKFFQAVEGRRRSSRDAPVPPPGRSSGPSGRPAEGRRRREQPSWLAREAWRACRGRRRSFLKYLRGAVVAGALRAPVAATTIAASACEAGGGGGGGACGAGDVEDDASFFDLEFTVLGDESAASDAEEERVEFNFAVAGEDVAASGGGEVVAVDAVAASAGADTGEAKDGAEEAERGEEQRPSGTACGGEVAVDAVAAPAGAETGEAKDGAEEAETAEEAAPAQRQHS
ncbi:hypothetical protein PVAP13_9KG027314 [Panicum virgatum]|uniref:Uncharacterized protein n=1 Tax=Panicum virgatum TaxID=38727 RepID=A0A8T0NBM4_PANVG|nr:hypothetical protein PVAP13_9KG027314 [Panicum virgatum]